MRGALEPVNERTQVAIAGAGPAGLFLSHLLGRAGIRSVVLESRDRAYIEARVRAGVIEHGGAELLRAAGVGGRMDREGLVHRGINLEFGGERHHVDFEKLTGKSILVYGQQEVVKDLVAARLAEGGDLRFEAEVTAIDPARPSVTFTQGGREHVLEADLVAACDGSFGAGRRFAGTGAAYDYEYEHAWLGILARTPPPSHELIYAYHERGFALLSMRSSEITRAYLQVPRDEKLENWPLERIWPELRLRLNEPHLREGEVLDIGITGMRSLVVEPMQRERLFLAGDAAHIVPPTGAKGMNLALGDVAVLAQAVATWLRSGDETGLNGYSAACARRIWRAQRFSWYMTTLLHQDPAAGAFQRRLRLADLAYTAASTAAMTSLAENYVGAATDGVSI